MSENGWRTVPLGVAIAHRKEFIEIDDLARYKRCRVQLHAKGIVLRDVVIGAAIKTKRQQVCRANEFLVAEIDAKVGGFGVVPETLDGAIVSSHYFTFTVNESVLDARFLDLFARTPSFRDQVSARGSTNYAAVRPEQVLRYTFPLPPLEEQRRIVGRIEEIAGKIEEARMLRRAAAEEAEAIARAGAKQLIFQAHADTRQLRDLVKVQGGGTPSKSDPTLWNGTIPWLSPKDMKAREILDSKDHVSEGAVSGPSRLIAPGAVLIVVRGMILAHTIPSAVLRTAAVINQDMKALTPTAELLAEYLCAMLWALNDELLDLVERSTHDTRRLETAKLLDFAIPLPTVIEQRRILRDLDSVQTKLASLARAQVETAAELEALLPSVLERAFRGEL